MNAFTDASAVSGTSDTQRQPPPAAKSHHPTGLQEDADRVAEPRVELVLIRGIPGSGKTTLARAMAGFEHFEADMFFEGPDGSYNYDRAKIRDAHDWCKRKTREALLKGRRVVVCNTFRQFREMEPYFAMAKAVGIETQVLEATGQWQNIHGVPDEMVERMRQRWGLLPMRTQVTA